MCLLQMHFALMLAQSKTLSLGDKGCLMIEQWHQIWLCTMDKVLVHSSILKWLKVHLQKLKPSVKPKFQMSTQHLQFMEPITSEGSHLSTESIAVQGTRQLSSSINA